MHAVFSMNFQKFFEILYPETAVSDVGRNMREGPFSGALHQKKMGLCPYYVYITYLCNSQIDTLQLR